VAERQGHAAGLPVVLLGDRQQSRRCQRHAAGRASDAQFRDHAVANAGRRLPGVDQGVDERVRGERART